MRQRTLGESCSVAVLIRRFLNGGDTDDDRVRPVVVSVVDRKFERGLFYSIKLKTFEADAYIDVRLPVFGHVSNLFVELFPENDIAKCDLRVVKSFDPRNKTELF